MDIHDTLAKREKTHGSFRSHAQLSQYLKEILQERTKAWAQLHPYQREALEMICHKMARIINGNPNEVDHWVDIAGYATLVADILKPPAPISNKCDCEFCRESASTITSRDSTVYDDDIKI